MLHTFIAHLLNDANQCSFYDWSLVKFVTLYTGETFPHSPTCLSQCIIQKHVIDNVLFATRHSHSSLAIHHCQLIICTLSFTTSLLTTRHSQPLIQWRVISNSSLPTHHLQVIIRNSSFTTSLLTTYHSQFVISTICQSNTLWPTCHSQFVMANKSFATHHLRLIFWQPVIHNFSFNNVSFAICHCQLVIWSFATHHLRLVFWQLVIHNLSFNKNKVSFAIRRHHSSFATHWHHFAIRFLRTRHSQFVIRYSSLTNCHSQQVFWQLIICHSSFNNSSWSLATRQLVFSQLDSRQLIICYLFFKFIIMTQTVPDIVLAFGPASPFFVLGK